MPPLSRRTFIRQAACAAVGTAGVLSAVWDLRKINAAAALNAATSAAAAAPGDFKALVCVFLAGGNDGNNTLIPRAGTDYAAYAAARDTLAIAQNALLPLTVGGSYQGPDLGFHPALPKLQGLFNAGRLAVVANVGTLVEPTTRDQYKNGSVKLPYQLFSHSEQQHQWQSTVSGQIVDQGWGGITADLVNALNPDDTKVSMTMSVGGTTVFEVGNVVNQFQLSPYGVQTLNGYLVQNPDVRSQAFKEIIQQGYSNLFEQEFANVTQRALDADGVLQAALANVSLQTTFPQGSYLAAQLRMVAKLIAARNAPGMPSRRQIFFCLAGGFDTHGDQLNAQQGLLADLDGSLDAFHAATVELGVESAVTTFTASDFGRNYVHNGAAGSDHAWGNHHFVLGGAVRGGQVYGELPTLAIEGPDDSGSGRWIPTTSVEEHGATLARWFGVSATDLATVFPNLSRFPSGACPAGLGFMQTA